MSNRSSRSTVSNPIICCFVTHWGSTTHGMRHPQHKKTVRTLRPLEHGMRWLLGYFRALLNSKVCQKSHLFFYLNSIDPKSIDDSGSVLAHACGDTCSRMRRAWQQPHRYSLLSIPLENSGTAVILLYTGTC